MIRILVQVFDKVTANWVNLQFTCTIQVFYLSLLTQMLDICNLARISLFSMTVTNEYEFQQLNIINNLPTHVKILTG